MALSATQKKRLEEIGAYLIEEGFSDVLADVGLLPKLSVIERAKISVSISGSNVERLVNVLQKMGTTGEAFAFFASHRPDLFNQTNRASFAKLARDSRNKTVHFDSITADKLLKKIEGNTTFEQLPFLVTPFASYYRAPGKIAKLYHVHSLMQIHTDLQLIRDIIANMPEQHSQWLAIICEFADFVVDYFSQKELATLKRTTTGALFAAPNGTALTDVKHVLKHAESKTVSDAMSQLWFSSVFDKQQLLYDIYSWQWSEESKSRSDKNPISYQDIEPLVSLTDRELRILLSYFTALAKGDEQTAAACVISMCDATDASLDLVERLVSSHSSDRQRHIFEAGIEILEDANVEGMRIKPAFAKIAASGAQFIFIAKQYSPHDKTIFDVLLPYLAAHDIILQQISHTAPEEIPMNPHTPAPTTAHTNDQTHVTTQAIERLAKEIDKSSNRVAYSAIIAAFTIAGALLVSSTSDKGLVLLGLPFFVIAFFSSLLLIASIVKEPK